MDCKNIIEEAFSDLAPTLDSKAICAGVTERAGKMEKKKTGISRGFAAALVAAAVLGTATVTVGAVTGWDFNAAFGAIFSNSAEAIDTNEAVSDNLFDFESHGKLINEIHSFDDYTLNIKAITADQTTAYILYDVTFDESYDYQPKEGWTDWSLCALADALEEGEVKAPIGRVYRNETNVIKQEGNTLSSYITVSLTDAEDTFSGKTLTLDFGELSRVIPTASEKDDRPHIEQQKLSCGLHTEIKVDFPLCNEIRSFEINKEIEFSEGGVTAPAVVKTAKLTPFSWEFFVELDTSGFEKADGYLADIEIKMSDGTFARPEGCMIKHSENGSTYRGVFDKPIDLDSVVSVELSPMNFD